MTAIAHSQKLQAILTALKMRLYLSFGYGYSLLFPTRDVLLIRADRNARRRITAIQRLPARLVILTTVGLYFYFLVAEDKVGLMLVLILMPSVIIPIAVLLGAFVASRVDSIDVCLRREYMRLCEVGDVRQNSHPVRSYRPGVAERMVHYRLTWYQERRKMRKKHRCSVRAKHA